ncbi:MAG: HD domain-containing protein [Patescibacteria group bacterium]
MIVHDRIYGRAEVHEPVLLALLACPSVDRLRRSEQLGLPREMHIVSGFSRFEHSVGVMLLLRRLDASVEEQVAGLLHDVSHTAFSHIMDWFHKTERHDNYQDSRHREFLMASEIPDILKRFYLVVDRIANPHLFSLLEADIPHLCADRVDYALRQIPFVTAAACVDHIVTFEHRMAFNDPSDARTFADAYIHLQDTVWRGFEGMSRYRIFVRVLERALELGRITLDDFDTDDRAVMQKIASAPDLIIDTLMNTLRLRSLEHLPKESTLTFAKPRFVDPLVVEGQGARPLSAINAAFAQRLVQAKERNAKGIALVSVTHILSHSSP